MRSLNLQTRKQWHGWRYVPAHARIGASQIAPIMGVGFNSTYEEWAKYHGYQPQFDAATEALLRHGHEDEAPLARWLYSALQDDGTPLELDDPGDYTVFQHEDHPWAFATPDRVVGAEWNHELGAWLSCEPFPVELKSPRHQPRVEWEHEPPVKYALQLQWQMYCMGASRGIIAARYTPEIYHVVDYDPEAIEIILPHVEAFREHVLTGNPPQPDGSDGARRAILARYADSDQTVIELPEYEGLADSLESLKQFADDAQAKYESARQRLMEAMGPHQFAVIGEKCFSFKPQKRKAKLSVPPRFKEALEVSNINFSETAESEFRVLREIKKLPRDVAQEG